MIPISTETENKDLNNEITPEETAETAKPAEFEEASPAGVAPEATENEPSSETETTVSEEAEDTKKKSRKERKEEKKESEKLAVKEQELALLNDKYLRLCAEYDNYRKRSQKEKDSRYNDAKEDVITKMLPVYDNLIRALAQKTEDEAYYKGVEMIMTQFNSALEKLGVTEIPALGEKFNPEVHNAVMHIDDEEKGENEVVDVFQKGFKLGDKVIRFAMVKVAN